MRGAAERQPDPPVAVVIPARDRDADEGYSSALRPDQPGQRTVGADLQ